MQSKIARWCNGSTSDSGSACEGSSPSRATAENRQLACQPAGDFYFSEPRKKGGAQTSGGTICPTLIPAPLFLPFHRILSLGAHAAIPAAERESSGVERVVLWIPHQVWNGRTMTRESVCCHSGSPPGIRSPLRARRSPNDREKEKTALIGPGGRQPRAEKGRGLCERSEFRSPRARRRRPSEKARCPAAVLLGSFFSPKRRMNKKPFMDSPSKRGMTEPFPHRAGNDVDTSHRGNGHCTSGVVCHVAPSEGETSTAGV